MFNRSHEPESPVADWAASLTIIVACAAFALMLARGPQPAMDRVPVDAAGSTVTAATAPSAPAPAERSSTSGG
jgi:hypothetical protein